MYHSKIPRSIPKTKTKVIFYTDKFSRSTDRILQSVSKVLTATLITLDESHRLIIHAGLSSPSVLILEFSLPSFLSRNVLKGIIGLLVS